MVKKWNIPKSKLAVFGMLSIILGIFVFMAGLGDEFEFPENLYGLYIFVIIGVILLLLEYYYVEREELNLMMALMVIIVFLGIPTYMGYTEHRNNHFFDNHEIINCDKNISKCIFGISVINRELNYFFCADVGKRQGSKENAFMNCTWREEEPNTKNPTRTKEGK